MDTKEKIEAVLAALDEARRSLEALAADETGDEDVDGAVGDACATIEGEIAVFTKFLTECD